MALTSKAARTGVVSGGGSKRLVHCTVYTYVRPRTSRRVNLKIKWVGLHLLLDMASGRLGCASSSTGHTPEVTSIHNYEVLVSSWTTDKTLGDRTYIYQP